ncbi:MAG: GTPase Era [Gammaproteobacteria bacterium]|nr:GTPase Era [Gammaproteobacteria bacterium]MBK7168724.1 GTPase Era [Gammaproteobacteria bacterium]MBK7520211.1 GTPase Era [Gammaproteobacteria bacterium]MBK7729568.1 GTPase Era [Gammaproteobacteria bacterium]MBK8308655.1 GTPase Era [Gammaproteobacteria bacterium]
MGAERCGLVAIIGRPNVGKSTLLNHLLGQKISITSRKPQTTRHRILGVSTRDEVQTVYVDTPGLHRVEARAINRVMNRAARAAVRDVDVVLMVVERLQWVEEDEQVLQVLRAAAKPALLIINKIDQIDDKAALLPHIARLKDLYPFVAIVPVSALKGSNLAQLEGEVGGLLPEAPHLFPADQVTDRSERFLVAEIIREKLIRQLGEELPYANAVQIEEFSQQGGIIHISGLIIVEKPGQKAIVIGRGGERLKQVGVEARHDMERLLGSKVMLKLWVKVRSGWADDERALASLGYQDDG